MESPQTREGKAASRADLGLGPERARVYFRTCYVLDIPKSVNGNVEEGAA